MPTVMVLQEASELRAAGSELREQVQELASELQSARTREAELEASLAAAVQDKVGNGC